MLETKVKQNMSSQSWASTNVMRLGFYRGSSHLHINWIHRALLDIRFKFSSTYNTFIKHITNLLHVIDTIIRHRCNIRNCSLRWLKDIVEENVDGIIVKPGPWRIVITLKFNDVFVTLLMYISI
jgi:hypothetical protein